MNFHVVTIFPESLDSYINASILERARKSKKISIKTYNPRDFSDNKHRKVDSRPYGGGPGMVMMAGPIIKAVKKALGSRGKRKTKVIVFSPSGKLFTNRLAKKWSSSYTDIVMVAGRYEGIDARVRKILRAEEISVGPFILTGGELASLVVMDAVSRQVKGVLGKMESLEESRSASGEVYTRPETISYMGKKYRVPKILLTGDHKKIEQWRIKNKSDCI